MQNKRIAGIWLDQTRAFVVKNHNGQEVTELQPADQVTAVIQQGNSNENTGNNAEITNKHKFFKNIIEQLTNTEDLYITGPGTIQEELKSYLADTAQYKDLKVTLDTSQQMNEQQLLDAVKNHYNL